MDEGVQGADGRQQARRFVFKKQSERILIQGWTFSDLQFTGHFPKHTAAHSGFKLTGETGLVGDQPETAQKIDPKPLAALLRMPAIPGFKEGKLLATE